LATRHSSRTVKFVTGYGFGAWPSALKTNPTGKNVKNRSGSNTFSFKIITKIKILNIFKMFSTVAVSGKNDPIFKHIPPLTRQ
jgi:hypothetical protein